MRYRNKINYTKRNTDPSRLMRPCCSTPSYDILLSRSCYKLNPKLYQPDMKQKIALAHLYLKFMSHLKL